jgi:hypothetical protein
MVTVHRYRLFDEAIRDWVVQLSKSSEERIRALSGQIIEGTADEVDAAMIDAQGRYVPSEH